VYNYNFPDDRLLTKTLAYFVFLLETVQTTLNGADIYYWFVEGYGNVERLKDSHFAPIDIPFIHATISFIVQAYLCYRIWTLNGRSSKLCMVIAVFIILGSSASVWGGIKSITAGGKYAVSKVALYLWSIPSVISDVMIAIAMILLRPRARISRSKYSNFVMMRLVRLTIETNALTAGLTILTFILFVAFPNNIYYVFLAEMTGKLYANTLLLSLNNRIYFRDYAAHHGTYSLEVHVDSSHHMEGDRSRRSAISSLQARSPTDTTAVSNNTFKLDTISHIVDLEKSKGEGDAIDTTPGPDGKC